MKDADQIVIAANGAISLGAVGATVDPDPDVALGDEFNELGYATEEGVTFSDTPELLRIMSWQSKKPTRTAVDTRTTTAATQLQQWNRDTTALAFGGGEWVEEEVGLYRFDPPSDSDDLPEYCLVIDWEDGDRKWRWVGRKVSVTEGVEANLVRSAEAPLPVTLEVLAPDGDVLPWNLYSNDPAFAPAGS